MRLIGTLDDEKKAYRLSLFFSSNQIQNHYDSFIDSETKKERYRIWVIQEEDVDRALSLFDDYQKSPGDPKFDQKGAREPLPPNRPASLHVSGLSSFFTLVNLVIFVTILLFVWENAQKRELTKEKGSLALKIGFTPIMQRLMFDYTHREEAIESFIASYPLKELNSLEEMPEEGLVELGAALSIPAWKGLYDLLLYRSSQEGVVLFEKLRQGEGWRLWTPSLLHHDLLHILVNLSLFWLLGRQMEGRMGALRFLCFLAIVGVLSNTAQYLMTGPSFSGLSGSVVGMAAFIWMRQRKAAWETYFMHWGVSLFLLYFVVGMFILGLTTFFMQIASSTSLSPHIGNTAHITGGAVGFILGKLDFFAERRHA